jgi:hypothetical protein
MFVHVHQVLLIKILYDGQPKVSGMVVFHCHGWTYVNAYLITFKVGHLRSHTIPPSIMPLLETRAEGFGIFLCLAIEFDLMSSIVRKREGRKHLKVAWSEIWRVQH